MGVHLGLISAVNSSDELASVLGHELSHITQRHIARSIGQQGKQTPLMLGAMIVGMLAASRTGSLDAANAANAVMIGGPAAMMQSQLNFSRDMEREADRIGYSVMSDAGYNTQGFVTMFEKLDQAARLNDSGNFPYLRSHPMTTERIADAKARQQLASHPKPQQMTPLHAMMSARAQVLVDSSAQNLDRLVTQLTQNNMAKWSVARQIQVVYAATLAQIRLREWSNAQQNIDRLSSLVGADVLARPALTLLEVELAMAQGHGQKAIDLLLPKAQVLQAQPREVHLLLAQARLGMHQAAQTALSVNELQLWVSEHPQDAQAWHLLAQGLEAQAQPLRSLRANAESFAAQYDFQGAVDRLKAAQQLVLQHQQLGQLSNADQMEASIIDARLHAVQKLAREQALQR
jgi:predicted Zn-dependent protease